MTANGDDDPESDNSGSPGTDADKPPALDREDALPVIVLIRARGGWIVAEDLVKEFGLTVSEMDEYLDLLERTGEIERHELGRHQLITLPDVDVREAIAAWSDRKEREWRQLTGDRYPDRDEDRDRL